MLTFFQLLICTLLFVDLIVHVDAVVTAFVPGGVLLALCIRLRVFLLFMLLLLFFFWFLFFIFVSWTQFSVVGPNFAHDAGEALLFSFAADRARLTDGAR